jgi:hypothetical protein
MSRIFQILLCVAVLASPGLHAQAPDGKQPPPQTQTPPAEGIDPTKLGISFERVRFELTQPVATKDKRLKIQETIEVTGKAPPILFWDPKTVKATLTSQAVPYGAPTQKDIMKLIVPKEFQNYPFDMNALMQWLMDHLNKSQ